MDDCIPPSLKLFDKKFEWFFFSDKHSVSCSSIDNLYYRSSHDISDWLDGAGSIKELLGQAKVMQIRQRETAHEICCLAAQLSHN